MIESRRALRRGYPVASTATAAPRAMLPASARQGTGWGRWLLDKWSTKSRAQPLLNAIPVDNGPLLAVPNPSVTGSQRHEISESVG